MKKFSKLKLNVQSEQNMEKRGMEFLKGGGTVGDCGCGCYYSGSGGSSTDSNFYANFSSGYHSKGMTPYW